MIQATTLTLFIPTFFFVSITPGMCMTLAMSLGMTIGLRKTLWMMLGELVGVGLVAFAGVIGVAAVMLTYPSAFLAFKIAGGCYLAYLGIQLWMSKGKMAVSEHPVDGALIKPTELITQGFVTAVANPKGWAFFIALFPPFIDPDLPLSGQLIVLISIILLLEFICLLLYTSGGKWLGQLLKNNQNVKTLNRVAGTLMFGVALWLVLG